MRVYWEGAAMMLLADQRLRSRTGGAQSLDSALAQLRACCLSPDTGWQARELFAKLDELTQTSVFAELYEAHVASTAFPPVAEAYRLLGLAAGRGGREHPHARRRAADRVPRCDHACRNADLVAPDFGTNLFNFLPMSQDFCFASATDLARLIRERAVTCETRDARASGSDRTREPEGQRDRDPAARAGDAGRARSGPQSCARASRSGRCTACRLRTRTCW